MTVITNHEVQYPGLRSAEAQRLLVTQGENRVGRQQVGWLTIMGRQVASPFVYLLGGASLVSFILGEWIDGCLILFFIGVNVVLAFVQEYRSEKSLEALEKFVVPLARVIRDGHEQTIPAAHVVVGDILLAATGDALAADVLWLEAEALAIDESILTGESKPVDKSNDSSNDRDKAHGYAATIVVQGEGIGRVMATGSATQFGQVSKLTLATNHSSGFEQGLATFSRVIIKLMLGIVGLLFIINLFIKGWGVHIPELVLFSIALAVSVVPEALPVVTTVAFSRGALRLAKNQVVVKRLSAVEDLGSIEVLCTDKTGTITENTLAVAEVTAPDLQQCLEWAYRAAYLAARRERESSSSFDTALQAYAKEQGYETNSAALLLEEIPFDPERRRMSMLVAYQSQHFIIVRGAPEELSLISRLADPARQQIGATVERSGKRGERTLGVAFKAVAPTKMSLEVTDEAELTWLGVVSFHDPVKPSVKDAVARARALGVAVKILTGDHLDVAGAVAREVGLIASHEVGITGAEFDALSPDGQRQAVLKHQVFARVTPTQKFAIIKRLQEQGKEVGFLGEGINDAPALKAAEVGIVVQNASDLAREAADIVLLNCSLSVIIDGIRHGREVFENVIKYIKITLIGNFGNFFTLALVSLLLPYVPLLPIQILLLNIVTDLPLIAIATDRIDGTDLKRPRTYNLREIVIIATVLGLTSSVFDFALFGLFVHTSPGMLRTAWFLGSALAEFVVVFLVRSRRSFFVSGLPSRLILVLIGLACSLIALCLWVPYFQQIFMFIPLTPKTVGMILVLTFGYAVTTEYVKRLYYRFARRHA